MVLRKYCRSFDTRGVLIASCATFSQFALNPSLGSKVKPACFGYDWVFLRFTTLLVTAPQRRHHPGIGYEGQIKMRSAAQIPKAIRNGITVLTSFYQTVGESGPCVGAVPSTMHIIYDLFNPTPETTILRSRELASRITPVGNHSGSPKVALVQNHRTTRSPAFVSSSQLEEGWSLCNLVDPLEDENELPEHDVYPATCGMLEEEKALVRSYCLG
ncbi:hypothetical protein HYFRA_00011907 [Hymenoscyphus fraxineus]|uniref:Uncharacterized protein n=1 Tax=Hymenoscyphus fraxineus TaxID=746836 RepID=A0A9N9L0W0_9HELO|nr:hypothetical protein HYFRA_00011907 [Hymenoscyphus fraxineus]